MNSITFGSSLFYSFIACVVFANCVLAEKYNKKAFVWLNIIILTFIAGFRAYSVGRDTYQYTVIFENPFSTNTFSKDPLFCYLSFFLMKIWDSPSFLFLAYGFIIYALVGMRLWELKKYSSFTYSFMFFFSFTFFESMNGLRQYVAVAIVFWGTRYLFNGKYFKYIITIFVAYVFHVTALLGILGFAAELLNWNKLSKINKRFIVFMTIIGVASGGYIVRYLTTRSENYMHYFNNAVINVGFRLIALFAIFMISLFLFCSDKYVNLFIDNTGTKYFLTSVRLYYLFAIALGAVGYFYPLMERLAWTYVLFEGVYFGMLAKEVMQIRRWLLKIPIVFIILYVLINYIFFKNGALHHPYIFVWNQ